MIKVLIVDDERMIKMSMRSVIETEAEGFVVVAEADDGREALALAEYHQPDIIITDIRMSVMDGLALIHELRARHSPAEFVIVSGYADFEYARSALRYHVTDYLLKPIHYENLLSILNKIKTRLSQEGLHNANWNKWVLDSKAYAEQAARAIWNIREEELNAELERMKADLQAEASEDTSFMAKKYRHYFSLFCERMELVSHNAITLPSAVDWNHTSDWLAIYEHIRAIMTDLMESVRANRMILSQRHMMRDVLAYIEQHLDNPRLSLKDAADYCGLSANYFGSLFKKTTGESFLQYLTKIRINRAKSLLLQPFAKVYEIGLIVGFEDYSHFSKIFKKQTGFSPTAYRKSADFLVHDEN
ncbi:response regulator transcription factor [Paenibacillus thalictri]|uniref:Response regulator n=1 Tax=Paenibacillus thalictri TaxID=2527873 RepID=A0A4Q9DL58_9BACL|nr:response regulator [Paenibacillus thalictri]TBL75666.1 response regulator [Paenibacillus thalictri]